MRINSFLIKKATWNEQLIQERTVLLIDLCKQNWPYPELPKAVLTKYRPKSKVSKIYTLNDYDFLNPFTEMLYEQLDKRIINISPDVKREFKKSYISYKVDTNFVDIVIQKSRLRLAINIKFGQVYDPKGLCKDVAEVGRWGNGDVEIFFENLAQIDDVMANIEQSYNNQC